MLYRQQPARCVCGHCSRAVSLLQPRVGPAARQPPLTTHRSGPIAATISLQQQEPDLQQQQQQQQQQLLLLEQTQAAVLPGPRRRPPGPRSRLARQPTGSSTPPLPAGAAASTAGAGAAAGEVGGGVVSSSSSADATEAAAGQLLSAGSPAAAVDSPTSVDSSAANDAGHAHLDTDGQAVQAPVSAAASADVAAAAAAASTGAPAASDSVAAQAPDGAAAPEQNPATALPDVPAATAAAAAGAAPRRPGPLRGRIGPPRPPAKRAINTVQPAAAVPPAAGATNAGRAEDLVVMHGVDQQLQQQQQHTQQQLPLQQTQQPMQQQAQQQQQQAQAAAPQQPSWKIALQKHQEYQRRLKEQLQQQQQQQQFQQQQLEAQLQQSQPESVLSQPDPSNPRTGSLLSTSSSSTSTSPPPAAETSSRPIDSPAALESSSPPESGSPRVTASDRPQTGAATATQSDSKLLSESDRAPLSESDRATLSGPSEPPLGSSVAPRLGVIAQTQSSAPAVPGVLESVDAAAGPTAPQSSDPVVPSAAQDTAAQHTDHAMQETGPPAGAVTVEGQGRATDSAGAAAGAAASPAAAGSNFSDSEPGDTSIQPAPPSSSDDNSSSANSSSDSSNSRGDGSNSALSSASSEGSSEGSSAAAERRRRRSSRRQARSSTTSTQEDDSMGSLVPAADEAAALDAAAAAAISASDAAVSTSGDVAAEPVSAVEPAVAHVSTAAAAAVIDSLVTAAAVTEVSRSAAATVVAATVGPQAAAPTALPSPVAASQAAADTATQRVVAAAPRRRVISADSKTPGGTGLSATVVGKLLAGQRKLSKGAGSNGSKAGAAKAGSSSSGSSNSSTTTNKNEVGEITHVNGVWKLSGFIDDIRAMDSLVPALQQRLMAGVQAEQAEEQTAIRKLYAASSLKQLQRDGIVLLQLQASPSHVLYSSMVWRFSLAGVKGRDLPYHRFRQGDSLLVSRFSEDQLVEVGPGNSRSYGMNRASVEGSNDLRPGSNGFRPLDATVVEVRKDYLLLALEKSESDRMQAEVKQAAAAPLVSWRLDQSVRDTTARRQMDAVRRLSQPTTNSAFEALLRMVFVGTQNGAFGASVPPEWAREAGWRQDVRLLLQETSGLNASQKSAIANAVLRSFTLWQGPPGTGKTRTLLALVEVLVKTAEKQSRRWEAMGPILACGDTNAAVDNLVEGLLNKGLRVVRLGQPAKVRENLRQYTLEAQAAKTPDGRRAEELRKDSKVYFEQAKQLAEGSILSWGNRSRSTGSDLTRSSRAKANGRSAAPAAPAVGSSEGLEKEAKRKWAEAERLSKKAAREVLQEAQVVCATCSGAGDPLLNDLHFNMVVIDEATQATEPATLVPLTQGARCVVMAGDPAQLPPTVTSQEAGRVYGLTVTLFERLQKTLGLEPLLLNLQYRMNPAISRFPSHQFYQGKLEDGVKAEQKPAAAGLPWPQHNQPVMVLPVEGMEEQAKRGKAKGAEGSDLLVYGQAAAAAAAGGGLMESSYRNLQEARVTLQAVYALMTAGDVQTAAILTPYKGQVRAFEHALRVLSHWFTPELLSRITVSSVDGYQGREADVVLFSAVRCNQQGRIGFVSDRRRLNVAITRPRRGLVVVCSPGTLQKGSADWEAFMSWCQERQWVTSPRSVPAAPWQLRELTHSLLGRERLFPA